MSSIPKIILNNPFRILGVFANATKREIVANQSQANAFLKVNRSVEYPLDLLKLMPPVKRTVEIFHQANASLTISKEQVKYAQFWFLKQTPLDDVAFNHLYAGNLQQAIEIWDKKDCVSSMQNKVVANFIALNFDQAVNIAENLYAQFSGDFLKIADGSGTLNLSKADLIQSFIDTLCAEYEPKKIYDIVKSDVWKDILSKKTIRPLIDRIVAAIKKAKAIDDDNAKANLQAALKLRKDTKDDFAELKKILPADDMQLESIADKLGLTILQCGINYYNHSDDDDAAEKAMTLQKAASGIVIGEMAKDRCEENVKILKKIIAELPPKEVRKEYEDVENKIETYTKRKTISNAVSLLNETKPILQSIKGKLGRTNDDYLKLSTVVVSIAMRFIVSEVNAVQSSVGTYLTLVKDTFQNAWDATLLMDEFDLESDFKSIYDKNRSALKSMCSDLGISTTRRTAAAVSTPKPSPSSVSNSSSSPVVHPTSTPPNPPKPANNDDEIDWGIVLFIHIVYGFLSFIPGFGERGLNPILNFLLGMVAGLGFWVIPLNMIPYHIIKWIKKQMNS